MTGHVIGANGLKTGIEILLMNGDRVVTAWPNVPGGTFRDDWPDLHTANHNVFRLDAAGNVVWQVTREEGPHVDWAARHAHAKAEDPAAEGYFDPFWSLGLDERGALSTEPAGIFRPGCKVYLTTRWWSYELDVETGVATCTGNQVK